MDGSVEVHGRLIEVDRGSKKVEDQRIITRHIQLTTRATYVVNLRLLKLLNISKKIENHVSIEQHVQISTRATATVITGFRKF